MFNRLVALFMAATFALVGAGSVLAQPSVESMQVVAPATVSGSKSVAVELRLASKVTALDGRVFFDTSVAELIGVAPAGGGTGMSPVAINGGAAFGAYGLKSRNGTVVVRLVMAPLRAGALKLRVVLDHVSGASMDADDGRAAWMLARENGSFDSSYLGATSTTAPVPAAPSTVQAAASLTFTVTSTADTPDDNNGDGQCADSHGRCTLRAAMTESNWHSGADRIEFGLPGTAPVLIQLSSNPMPLLNDKTGGVVIDAYSQPGSKINTSASGSNAVPGVELRGTGSSPRGNAFFITSSNNTIRGFLMNNFYRPIVMDGSDSHHNLIAGNLIGFKKDGTPHGYEGNRGVQLNVGAHHNTVGTPSLANRNVIGNFIHAVDLYGPGTDNNLIQNNALCMTPSGTARAECATGIDHNFGPKSNLSGGLGNREGNVIGRTRLNGIEISHGWDPDHHDTTTKWQNNNNRIIGNWIGFRGNGAYDAAFRSGQRKPTFNDANGVNVYDGSNFNTVEGNYIASVYDGIQTMTANSTGNVIRNNVIGELPLGQAAPLNRYGIVVREASKAHFIEGNIIRNAGVYGIALLHKGILWVRISRNIITDMTGPAIYLMPNPKNPTQGANNLLAAPVITNATRTHASGTGIAGATVEVYAASRAAGKSGLPTAFLGSATVAGNGSWSVNINVAAGSRVTALQISTANNTSALGVNVTATN